MKWNEIAQIISALLIGVGGPLGVVMTSRRSKAAQRETDSQGAADRWEKIADRAEARLDAQDARIASMLDELQQLRVERDLFNAQLANERRERALERDRMDYRLTRQGRRIAQLEEALAAAGTPVPPWPPRVDDPELLG